MKILRLALLVSTTASLVACISAAPPDDTGAEADADTDSDADTDTDTDTDADGDADCDAGPSTPDYGELNADEITWDNYTHDAGLAAVIDADPGDGNTAEGEWVVTDAIVTLTGYAPEGSNPDTFWVADASGSIVVYRVDPGFVVKAGDTISFTVNQVGNYAGLYQISGASDFAVADVGSELVYVVDGMTNQAAWSLNPHEIIYSYGEVTAEHGECGTSYQCFDYTAANGNVTALRLHESKGLVKGDCLQVTAPMGTFAGSDQYNVNDLDWVNFY